MGDWTPGYLRKPKEPQAPAFQASQYKLGDTVKSSSFKDPVTGVVTNQVNMSPQEKQTYDYLQGQLPSLYQKATQPQDFTAQTDAYVENQTDALNRQLAEGTRILKAGLVNSGQVGSSIAVDKLKPLAETYQQSLQNINANAPVYAQQLASSQNALNLQPLSVAQEGVNQYYGTGAGLQGIAASAQQQAQNVANTGYQGALSAYNEKQKADATKLAALYTAVGTAASASDIKIKKNIKFIERKKDINFYIFEYDTDKYPELPTGTKKGVIAQEIENIIPDAVIQGKDYKLVDYDKVNKYLEEVA